jgi:hypothetical protein
MYKLYRVGDRTEPCGTPVCMYLGVDTSPSTKEFYPKCQSARVLPSSQSTWRIAAPSCIGTRPASRQSIRDARPERQSQ